MQKLSFEEYIREKNLCAVLEMECTNEFVINIDKFFDDLFKDLVIYNYVRDENHSIVYMQGDRFIMESYKQVLWCRESGFWSVLDYQFDLRTTEIKQYITYKFKDLYNVVATRVLSIDGIQIVQIEESYFIDYHEPFNDKGVYQMSIENSYVNGKFIDKDEPTLF